MYKFFRRGDSLRILRFGDFSTRISQLEFHNWNFITGIGLHLHQYWPSRKGGNNIRTVYHVRDWCKHPVWSSAEKSNKDLSYLGLTTLDFSLSCWLSASNWAKNLVIQEIYSLHQKRESGFSVLFLGVNRLNVLFSAESWVSVNCKVAVSSKFWSYREEVQSSEVQNPDQILIFDQR